MGKKLNRFKRKGDLSQGSAVFVVCWFMLTLAAFITYTAFSSTQFEYPRSAYEAQAIFGTAYACPGSPTTECITPNTTCAMLSTVTHACKQLCDDNAYSLNWFWMQSHYLHILPYAFFPAAMLLVLVKCSAILAITCVAVPAVIAFAISLIGYIFVAGLYCWGSPVCGLQCPYQIENYGLGASGADKSTAYWIFIIVVPIMLVLTLATAVLSYVLFSKASDEEEKMENREERKELLEEFEKDLSGSQAMFLSSSSSHAQKKKKQQARHEQDQFMADLLSESATPQPRAYDITTRSRAKRMQRPTSR